VSVKQFSAFNRLLSLEDFDGEYLRHLDDYLQNELPLCNSDDRCHHNQSQLSIEITTKLEEIKSFIFAYFLM